MNMQMVQWKVKGPKWFFIQQRRCRGQKANVCRVEISSGLLLVV